jgi:DUF4097 and DUF4098 domain-containing protein YvlB
MLSIQPLRTLALAGALAIAVSCARIGTIEGVSFVQYDQRSSREEVKPLVMNAGDRLAVQVDAGKVNITTCNGSEAPQLHAMITAYGETSEEATRNLDAVQLIVERDEQGVSVRAEATELVVQKAGLQLRMRATIDVDARVPSGSPLRVVTGTGNVRADGPFGACDLESKYGNVDLKNASGRVTARSASGQIHIANVRSAPTVEAHSSYGHLEIEGVEAEAIDAASSSGNITIWKSRTPKQTVKTSYGNVTVRDASGAVNARTGSGRIVIEGRGADAAAGSAVEADTSYGNIQIRDMAGPLQLKTASGNIEIAGARGALDVRSSYGRIVAGGTFDNVRAASSSGDVHVMARPGSRVAHEWSVSSGYGNIIIALPENVCTALDAKTSYGSVHSDFPVLVQGGKQRQNVLRGVLNSGVASPEGEITVKTSSGNIKIVKSTE